MDICSCHFLCIVTFIMFMVFIENSSIFSLFFAEVFGMTGTIFFVKKVTQLKIICLFFLNYFGAHFGGVPLFIESC